MDPRRKAKAEAKKVLNEIKKSRPDLYVNKPKQRAQHQMTLGSLIKALQKERTGLFITLGVSSMTPGKPHSYYGYPSDLAFEPSTEPITVAQFIVVCETAIRASFVGPDHSSDYYRDYIMQASTPTWISELDTASKTGIVDLVPTDGYIQLITQIIEEEEEAIDDNK